MARKKRFKTVFIRDLLSFSNKRAYQRIFVIDAKRIFYLEKYKRSPRYHARKKQHARRSKENRQGLKIRKLQICRLNRATSQSTLRALPHKNNLILYEEKPNIGEGAKPRQTSFFLRFFETTLHRPKAAILNLGVRFIRGRCKRASSLSVSIR